MVVGLEEILSEGEQRAMAIGSFLAELGVAGHGGASYSTTRSRR